MGGVGDWYVQLVIIYSLLLCSPQGTWSERQEGERAFFTSLDLFMHQHGALPEPLQWPVKRTNWH